ncbi:uncharacterized protein LOC111332882 [Stylophora pistillata]|uniref:Uncharacterized protein n=1 Tax=Stylophora pistillata TaxID=50429 RepID=A0A2B4S4I4_STYPI|nr:uncharacterized protein LOC111332882 [Stylophora pistillata]PFX23507.1 hypothetical protein AWC38_SpisGene11946 [Stylophora pistillata]
MADKSWGDVSKEPVQDSHAHEKPLQTPRQETGVPQSQGFDRALPGPPQPLQGEISSTTKKLAEIIAALLVALLNLPRGSVTTACTMTHAAVQFLQTPLEDVDEIDKMKPEVQEIKQQLKGIRPKISELVEKLSSFPNHPAVDLGKWELDLILTRDPLAKCGIDIHISQGLVSRLVSEAQTVVKTSQVITGILTSAAIGYWYYCAYVQDTSTHNTPAESSMSEIWKFCPFILFSIFFMRKVYVYYNNAAQIVREGKRIKRELEESRRCYMKSKVTLEETLPSLKEVVDRYDGGCFLKKIKSE